MKDREWSWPEKKAKYDDGPWMAEPDKVQWTDPATGLVCLIHRNPLGALCGYVGVPASHPYYGKDYEAPNVEVHGGLTYADKCMEERPNEPEGFGVCHVVEPFENANVWWFGFDCAHFMDFIPGMYTAEMRSAGLGSVARDSREVYRDVSYVRREVTDLARQLAELSV